MLVEHSDGCLEGRNVCWRHELIKFERERVYKELG